MIRIESQLYDKFVKKKIWFNLCYTNKGAKIPQTPRVYTAIKPVVEI